MVGEKCCGKLLKEGVSEVRLGRSVVGPTALGFKGKAARGLLACPAGCMLGH